MASSLTRSYAKQKQAERDREKERKEREAKQREEQQRLEDENAYSKPLTKKDVREWVDKKPVKAPTPNVSHADILREQEVQRPQRRTFEEDDSDRKKKDKPKRDEPVRLGWDRPSLIGPQQDERSNRDDSPAAPSWRPYDIQPSNIGLVAPGVNTGPTDIGGGQPESDTRKSGYQPILNTERKKFNPPIHPEDPRYDPRTMLPTDYWQAPYQAQSAGSPMPVPGVAALGQLAGSVGQAAQSIGPTLREFDKRTGLLSGVARNIVGVNNLPGMQPEPSPGDWGESIVNTPAYDRMQYDINQRNQEFGSKGFGIGPAFQATGEAAGTVLSAIPEIGRRLFDRNSTWGDVGDAAGATMGGAMGLLSGPLQVNRYPAEIARRTGNLTSGRQATQDYMNTREGIGGTPIGANMAAGITAALDTLNENNQDTEALALANPAVNLIKFFQNYGENFQKRQQEFIQAVTPTPEQQQKNTPQEIARQQQYAYLNWADPQAVSKTFDALVDRDTQVATNIQLAQQAAQMAATATSERLRDEYATQAADYGYAAYRLKNAHPIELVNENTNVWRQLLFELVQPDVTDLAGSLFEFAELSPAARRLARTEAEVMSPAAEDLARIANMTVSPTEKLAETVTPQTAWQRFKQTFVGSTGASRAELDANALVPVVATLTADADTAADVRLLTNYLLRNPQALIDGVPAELFQSPGLLARATDGKITFGSIGLNRKSVQNALETFRGVGDEFLSAAKSLQSPDGAINKIDFMQEVVDSTVQGGYRRYGVATALGEAPLGVADARVKTLSGGQAYVEYVDKKGKLLSRSENMSLLDANKAAKNTRGMIKSGKLNETSVIGAIGDWQRKLVSPFYILGSPGTWLTNFVGATSMALSDGVYAVGSRADMKNWVSKFYGGVLPTSRSIKGAESAGNMGQQVTGGMGRLGRMYGAMDDFTGDAVVYRATQKAVDKILPQQLAEVFTPLLQQNGITDPKLVRSMSQRLYEVGRDGGDMVGELNTMLGGNAKLFNLSEVNPQWLDVLPPGAREKFGEILRTTTEPGGQYTRLVNEFVDQARTGWENQLQKTPPVPQRHSWMRQENAQDMGDIDQLGRLARKNGVPEAEVATWRKTTADAIKANEQKTDTLTNLIVESGDPKNRYLLYNVWGQIYDYTANVRQQLAQRLEGVYEKTAGLPVEQRGPIWQEEYFGPARQAWDARNQYVSNVLEKGAQQLRSGEAFDPNFGHWANLERAAGKAEQPLIETMRMEPGFGRTDSRLGQVIQAGRDYVDKYVAQTFAAARRFNTESGFDQIVSAERSTQIAGWQASSYLSEQWALVQEGKLTPGDFAGIRNQVYRELRQFETSVWGWTTRDIVEDGLNAERRTGLLFDPGFGEGQVELLYPREEKVTWNAKQRGAKGQRAQRVQQTTNEKSWFVRREDGSVTTLPDSNVPDEVKQRYQGLTPSQIEEEVQLEMDNIASAAPVVQDMEDVFKPVYPTLNGKPLPGAAGVMVGEDGARQPVVIVSSAGTNVAGDELYNVRMPDGSMQEVLKSELSILDGNGELRKLDDVQAMMDTSNELDMMDVKTLEETRKLYRSDWDRVARGSVGIKGGIDNFVARFYRRNVSGGGEWVIQLPDKLPGIQDLYGETIAGRRISGQADLEDFLQEYVGMKRQIDAIKQGEDVAKERYATLASRAEKLPPEEVERIKRELNLGGGSNVQNLEETSRLTTQNRTALGAVTPDTAGDAAAHALQTLETMRKWLLDNAQQVLQPAGQINEAQSLNIINRFKRDFLPRWDNIKYAAAEYSDRMRSFTVLDSTNRTRLDEMLGIGTPYSFFWTRTAKNAVERMVFEPHIWRRVNQYKQAMSDIREQEGDPQRYDGAMRVEVNGQTYYMNLNPMKYWPTLSSLLYNDYADPESANSALSFAFESMQQTGANFYPWYDAAVKATSGQSEDIYPASYIPQGKILAWSLPYVMGENTPTMARPNWYEYNVGRELTTMVTEGLITPEQAQMGQDILRQQRTGEQPLPEQESMFKELTPILDRAAKRAAGAQLTGAATSFATGVAFKPYGTDESRAIEGQNLYWQRGYDPETNPFGSQAAQRATLDAYPETPVRWGQGGIQDPEKQRPGVSATLNMKSQEQDAIYAEMQAAVENYLMQNPDAAKKDVDKIKSPFFDRLEALGEKYPSAVYPEGSGEPPKGMNPQERARWELERIIKASDEGKPEWPGDNADDATMQQYYADLAAFNTKKYDMMERAINNTLATPPQGSDFNAWRNEFEKLTKGQYASELDRNYDLRFASDIERDWSDVATLKKELGDAGWDEREAFVKSEFGDATLKLWQQYNGMEKGSEEKTAFYAAHPELSVVNTAAYNPTQYEELKTRFGNDAWSVYKGRPEHPGDGATKAELDAYYKKLDEYEVKHPGSSEISFWLNGLRKPDGLPDEYYRKDFGNDYAEAQRIFGENIFKLDAKTPASKQAYYNYMDAHPQLYGFREWKKQYAEMTPAEYMAVRQPPTDAEGMPALPTYYTGERPVGSGRQPIGGTPSAPTGIWPSADLSPGLQQQQAQNPMDFYTQAENQFRSAQAAPLQEPLTQSTPTSDILRGVDDSPSMFHPTPEPGSLTDIAASEQPLSMSQDEQGNLSVDQPLQDATTTSTSGAVGNEAQQWMNQSSGYQKAQEWIQRGVNVENEFGADARATWNAYLDLPEGDARTQYRAEHPEMKVYNLAAYNQKEYQVAKTMFGQDVLLAWARAPVYDGTPEQNEKRNRYWKENPQAFVAGAWVNGRPSGDTEGDKDLLEQWTPDLGADYATAMKMFGEDIWSVVARQKTLFGDKRARSSFYKQFPQYMKWSEWWYANLPDTQQASTSLRSGPGYDSLGHRAYGSWGGGGGYNPAAKRAWINMPQVYAEKMSGNLWNSPGEGVRDWRPFSIDTRGATPQAPPAKIIREWR